MKSVLIILTIFLLSFQQITAQFKDEARKMLNVICSEDYHGRAYALGGADKTAEFIEKHLKKYRLRKFDKNYFQDFTVKVNTFSGKNSLVLNGINLSPGVDYLFAPTSPSLSGKYSIAVINTTLINKPEKFKKFIQSDFTDKVILIDTTGLHRKNFNDAYKLIIERNILKAKAIIKVTRKNLTYKASQIQKDFPLIILKKASLPNNPKEINIEIESKYYRSFKTQNIIAYIKGKTDTSIVFTAHYDHLGTMGKNVFFPGANDNGSGVVSLLTLAKYFSKQKKLKYNIVFLFFSGEELGLQGSYYYTKHPVFPLSKIKFLVNLDMVGSGDKGIKVVNGTVFKDQFETLIAINNKNKYLPDVKIRGKAANSDHYFFFEKGVPSIFIYTLGTYKEYHNIYDSPERLPLSKFDGLMNLLIDFINNMQYDQRINIEKSKLSSF